MTCPKCSAPLDAVQITLGVMARYCSSCGGAFYEGAKVRAPLKPDFSEVSDCACPKCASAMTRWSFYSGKLVLDNCPQCAGYWFDQGEVVKLRKLSGVEEIIGLPKEHADALASGAAKTDAPAPKARAVVDEEAPPLRLKSQLELADPDWDLPPAATYRGETYKHFQTCHPAVEYVLGEFHWKVAVGETARTRDFVRPPFLLSNEVAEKDSQWSLGEYIQPEEVWQAFGMEGSPPEPKGVSAAQPNPNAEALGTMLPWAALYVLAAIALSMAHSTFGLNRQVHSQQFSYSAGDAEKSRISDVFDVPGRASNLQLSIDTNLDNHWAYFNFALINSDTDEALDFGREVSYYSGYDSDGSWSEGSRWNSAILPRVPPGRYYLRVEPESDAAQVNYSIRVRRDVPRPMHLFLALLALLAPLVWTGSFYYFFENARWAQSDHPWNQGSGEDDD